MNGSFVCVTDRASTRKTWEGLLHGVVVGVAYRAEGRRARAASHGGARHEAELRLARLRVDR